MRKFKGLSCILLVVQCFWAAKGAEPAKVYEKLRGISWFLIGVSPGRLMLDPAPPGVKLVKKFSRTLTKEDYVQIEKGLRAEHDGARFVCVWYSLIEINSEDSNRVAERAREELVKDERRVFNGFPDKTTILNSTRDPEEWRRKNSKWLPNAEQ